MILTKVEEDLIQVLREAKPYERVEITKDKDGKIDTYFIHRSQKVILKPAE